MAAQAKVMAASKLEQLVNRIQRHTGRPKEACWRLVIQHGIKGRQEHRRWTEAEWEIVREELVKRPIAEVAKKIDRTPKAIRNMLRRNQLTLHEIRCGDQLTVQSVASAVHIRKSEVVFWIEQKWLRAPVVHEGKRRRYIITPEALKDFLRHHHADLVKRGIRNLWRFEAYVEFCFAPKHTTGKHLLDERRDKRERAAFAEAKRREKAIDRDEEEDGGEGDFEERYGIEMAEIDGRARESENEDS
jgi:hypothetical protein